MFVRSADDREMVARLVAQGLNRCAIARVTGIPRSTVRNWLNGRTPPLNQRPQAMPPPIPPREYGYLLGIYLGDGYLWRQPRTWRLYVAQDSRYKAIVSEISDCIRAVIPGATVNLWNRDAGCVQINAYSKWWPDLFPQHGPGRKHDRRIVLEAWQQEIVDADPRPLVRGLIHSDGCRFVARQRGKQRTYEYARYMFTNRSEDIKSIFCDALNRLGIAWNRPNEKDIQISRKESVAAMDEFVGPKA